MNKFLLSILLMSLGGTVNAQSLDYITFRTVDGTEKSLPADGLKITFEGTQLHATAQKESADFQLADMSQMFFSMTPTGIEATENLAEKVAIVNGRLKVDAPVGAKVCVYTMDGRRVNDRHLLRGVYLVNVNGRTYKLMSK